jgi:hypothetical protein
LEGVAKRRAKLGHQSFLRAQTEQNLAAVGREVSRAYVADTGYWSINNMKPDTSAEVLIPPMPVTNGMTDDDSRTTHRDDMLSRVESGALSVREATKEVGISESRTRQLLADRANGRGGRALRTQMLEQLASDEGRALYAKRTVTVEPVFGNIKANLRCRRFSCRGVAAVTSEWRLICTVHNLLKIRTRHLAAAG